MFTVKTANAKLRRITINQMQRKPYANNGAGSFLINGNDKTGNAFWVSQIFIQTIFSDHGLSTRTPFLKLLKSTISFYELNITEEMLAANGGIFEIEDPRIAGRSIKFEKPGLKQFSHELFQMSGALEANINNAELVFDEDWGAAPAPRPTQQPAQKTRATNAPDEPEIPTFTEERKDTLEAEVPAEQKPVTTATVDQSELPA